MECESLRTKRRLSSGIVALAVLGVAQSALAAELAWDAPAGCATRAEVVEQVERLTGQSLSSIDAVDFEAHVTETGRVTAAANDDKGEPQAAASSSWLLRLVTVERRDGNRRQREIEATSCWEIRDAAAIAIAMAVRAEPRPAGDEAGPDTAAAARPEPEAAAPIARDAETDRRERERAHEADPTVPVPENDRLRSGAANAASTRDRVRVALGFGGVGDAGALPSPTLGAELEATVGWRRARAVLLGATFASRRKEFDDGSGGEFQLRLLGALGCYEPVLGAWNGLACAGLEVGTLSGEGVGDAVVSRSGSTTWKAGRLEIGAVSPDPEHLHFVLRLGVVVPWATPDFVLDGTRRVYAPESIVARASVGVELPL